MKVTSHFNFGNLGSPISQVGIHSSASLGTIGLGGVYTLNPDAHRKIVTLHGGPGMDSRYFFPFIADLAAEYDVVHYRQGVSGARDLEGLVDEVDGVVKIFTDNEIVLFGHSWGGTLLLEYLRRRGVPQNVIGVILCSWVYNTSWLESFKTEFSKMASDRDWPDLRWGSNDDYQCNMDLMAPLYVNEDELEAARKIFVAMNYDIELYNTIEAQFLKDLSLDNFLRNFPRVPTLSLSGTQDRVINNSYVRKGASLSPHIAHKDIEGGSHFPFIGKGVIFLKLVRDFILSVNHQKRKERT